MYLAKKRLQKNSEESLQKYCKRIFPLEFLSKEVSQGMINKSGSFSQQTYKYEDEKDHFQFVVHQILLVVSEQYVIIICGYQNFEFKTTADLMEMQISLWFTEED